MQYREITPIARHEAEIIFDGNDLDDIRVALLRVAYHEPDYQWAQDSCLRFCDHEDFQIRGVAALCLGHIGRIHGKLDLKKVVPVLRRLLTDQATVGQAEIALDDIKQYVC